MFGFIPICSRRDGIARKTELIKETKISTNAMAKLGRNEDIRVGVLEKICLALDCKLDDILDIVPDKE